jgi:hypothetical protein
MAAGVAVIIVNYIGIFPGGTNNKYLFMGLGSMAVGFGMTLWFH